MSDNQEQDLFMDYVNSIVFLGILALLILWIAVILSSFFASFGAKNENDAQAVNERLKPIAVVSVAGAPAGGAEAAKEEPKAAAGPVDGSAVVAATCQACHGTGLLNSPKIGDKDAWNARLEAAGGVDGLLKSAIAGKGAMPSRGGNASLSDAEIKAAIEFMSSQ